MTHPFLLLNLSCFRKLYEEGTQVTLTAASNTILTFTNWTGDNGETAGEIKINMNTNHSVTANYSAIDYICRLGLLQEWQQWSSC